MNDSNVSYVVFGSEKGVHTGHDGKYPRRVIASGLSADMASRVMLAAISAGWAGVNASEEKPR